MDIHIRDERGAVKWSGDVVAYPTLCGVMRAQFFIARPQPENHDHPSVVALHPTCETCILLRLAREAEK